MGTVFVNAKCYSLGSGRLGDELLGVSWSGGIGGGWGVGWVLGALRNLVTGLGLGLGLGLGVLGGLIGVGWPVALERGRSGRWNGGGWLWWLGRC